MSHVELNKRTCHLSPYFNPNIAYITKAKMSNVHLRNVHVLPSFLGVKGYSRDRGRGAVRLDAWMSDSIEISEDSYMLIVRKAPMRGMVMT